MSKKPLTPIQRAIAAVGNANKMAQELGVSRQFISKMSQGGAPVPPTMVLRIERATRGLVSRHELRPDVFGEAPQP